MHALSRRYLLSLPFHGSTRMCMCIVKSHKHGRTVSCMERQHAMIRFLILPATGTLLTCWSQVELCCM